ERPARALRLAQPRVLIVSESRAWLDEVLPLVPPNVELSCLTLRDLGDAEALCTEAAALIVFVGPISPGSQSPLRRGGMLDKPTVCLPIQESGLRDESSAWRRNAALALETAVMHLEQTQRHTTPEPESKDTPRLDTATGELSRGDRTVRVTPTECTLLRVLLASRGRWIPAAELRLRAFGPDHACHDSLIRVHVYKLRRKLENVNARIRSIKGRGYMLD